MPRITRTSAKPSSPSGSTSVPSRMHWEKYFSSPPKWSVLLKLSVDFVSPTVTSCAAVVGDIRQKYVGMREQLSLYDFTVLHGLPTPLLFSEVPFIDWRVLTRPALPFVSLALGPYCLLVGTPSNRKSRVAPVAWQAAVAMGPLKDHNLHMAERARLWLVATTDEQLVPMRDRLAAAKVEAEKNAAQNS